MFFNLFRHSFLLIFAYFASIKFVFSQLTTPQNISGTFGLQLNSYPQQFPYSPQTTSSGLNYYDQRYPSTQTDHYGYPSPEQLAQIPAPPLRQQQFTNPYSSSSSADWRGQQSTIDAWRNAQYRAQYQQQQYPGSTPSLNPEHSITNNNNLPYSQQIGGNDAQTYAQQLANRMYGQQQGTQQYQQGQYSPYGQQSYGGEQTGGNIGLQQLMPNREQIYGQQQHQQYGGGSQTPLNPQYQSPTSRIVFPGNNNRQQDEQNRHSFWFNSAIKIRSDAKICLALMPLLIAFLL